MNWGTKLIIGMAVFMLFIAGMAARMIYNDRDDLVENDYYEKGESFDSDYKEQQNAQTEGRLPVIIQNAGGIEIVFRDQSEYIIRCIHPFNSSEDIILKGIASPTGHVSIPAARLTKGTWNVDIIWISRSIRQRLKQQVIIR